MPRVSKEQNRQDLENVKKLLMHNPDLDVELIAQQSGLSTQQVYKILRNLENDKTLFGTIRLMDLEKVNRKRFIIMAKRSGSLSEVPVLKLALYSKEFLNMLAKEKIEIIPEDDYTCSGEYDMISVINADSTVQATKYVEFLRSISHGYFSKFAIIEVMFTTKRNSVNTPDIKRFSDYMAEVSAYKKN